MITADQTNVFPRLLDLAYPNIERGEGVRLWTTDGYDWKPQATSDSVLESASRVEDRGIVLLHDTYEPTLEASRLLVARMRARGLELVALSFAMHHYFCCVEHSPTASKEEREMALHLRQFFDRLMTQLPPGNTQ